MREPYWQPPRFFDRAAVTAWLRKEWSGLTEWAGLLFTVALSVYGGAGAMVWRAVHGESTPSDRDLYHSVTPAKALAGAWQYVVLPLLLLPFALLYLLWRWLGAMPFLLAAAGMAVIGGLLLPALLAERVVLISLASPFFAEELVKNGTLVAVSVVSAGGLLLSSLALALSVALLLQRYRAGRRLLVAGGCVFILSLFGLWSQTDAFGQLLLGADAIKTEEAVGPYVAGLRWNLLYCALPAGAALFLAGLGEVERALRPARAFTDVERAARFDDQDQPSDRMLEWVRTRSQRRSLLKSSYYIALALVMYMAALMLYEHFGCIRPYDLPAGVLQAKQVQKVQVKKKKKKRLLLNPNSAIAMRVPDMKDMKILKEIDEATQQTYKAGGVKGKKGPAGVEGGWSTGPIRFIRLKHSGSGWDVGMHDSSDTNMLKKFFELTGVKAAKESEAHPASYLAKYPPMRKPPFVYLTGYGSIGMSSADKRALKKYLMEEGGMLIADSGGAGFGGAMRSLLREICPGKELGVIGYDDEIFNTVVAQPDGAPPLWKHTGTQALGIKHNGRWVVFWHPGDMKDAWKTGHSGASPQVAQKAYETGVNVMYYAMAKYAQFVQARGGNKKE